jgi:hypothetical protein
MKVNELIDKEIGRWKFTIINQLFSPWDAAEITKIPLRLTQQKDYPDMEV